MTDVEPLEPKLQSPSWALAIVLGLALLPIAKVLPPALSVPIGLVAAGVAGALTASSPLLAGAVVAVPLVVGAVVVGFIDSLGTGLLVSVAGGCAIGMSALAGAAGAMAGQGWADGHSDDPEAKERARRGVIVAVAALVFFGLPAAWVAASTDDADEGAADVERRLVAAVEANMPFDAYLIEADESRSHPIYRAVPNVIVISTPEGAELQSEVHAGASTRCVLVHVEGSEVTSRIAHDACGPLVGR